MRYISTRGQAPPVSFLDAVLNGMAPDGGLYVPESWPAPIFAGAGVKPGIDTYAETARLVLGAFAGDDLSAQEAADLADTAYWAPTLADEGVVRRWPPAVTPLVQIDSGDWILELFRGPSLSFKDIAMQLIAPLYDVALARLDRRLSVVCATSGDTGGAAVEALKGRERVDLFVLLPKDRVSDVQRLFMTASGADNVHAIVAQSVYFHIASAALAASGPVNFIVPTGNFGDAFSGYVAKKTGAPIDKITLATNSNDILARALKSGRYERAEQSYATLSPAMDIQLASNFERILFEVLERDGEAVSRLYAQFAQSGGFDIPPDALSRLRADFSSNTASDADTLTAMTARWGKGEGYLICPHTAVGLHVGAGAEAARVFLATAHPAKFPETVERATGVHPELPTKCADLFQRSEKFDSLPADAEAVKQHIRERSRAWT
ncbi:MAG: threonine synthase [Terricaulis sp.]